MAGTAPSSSDCVAYWALEDLTDKTGNGHTLTNSGATSGVTGILDDCYSFITNDYMTVGGTFSDFITSTGSISLWFKKSNKSTTQALFAMAEAAAGNDFFWVYTRTTGNLRFNINNEGTGAYNAEYQVDVCDGDWHHIVWTNDGTNNKYYFDGTDITSSMVYTIGADSGTWTGDLSGLDNFQLGRMYRGGATEFPLNGVVDEFSWWDVVLTGNNVTYLYNGGSPGSDQQFPFGAVDAQAIMMGMNF